MILFTWSLLAISGAMLVIQVEIVKFTFSHWVDLRYVFFSIIRHWLQFQHGNYMSILLNTNVNGVIGLALAFIVCEVGHRLNDTFDEINFTIVQLDWYLFPIEIKRMLPMIIVNTHQIETLKCFGSITCNRDVFKNVSSLKWFVLIIWINSLFPWHNLNCFQLIHRAYSYFMVLGQLDDWRLFAFFWRHLRILTVALDPVIYSYEILTA